MYINEIINNMKPGAKALIIDRESFVKILAEQLNIRTSVMMHTGDALVSEVSSCLRTEQDPFNNLHKINLPGLNKIAEKMRIGKVDNIRVINLEETIVFCPGATVNHINSSEETRSVDSE